MDEKLELLKKRSEEHTKEGKVWETSSKKSHVIEWTCIISEAAWAILEDDNLTHEEKQEMVMHFMASTRALKDALDVEGLANFIKEILSKEQETQGEA